MPGRTSRGLTICTKKIIMENKDILEIIINKIKTIKQVDDISLSDRYREDLGFDSVDMLELVLYLEKEFNISFSHPFIILTVEDTVNFINR